MLHQGTRTVDCEPEEIREPYLYVLRSRFIIIIINYLWRVRAHYYYVYGRRSGYADNDLIL